MKIGIGVAALLGAMAAAKGAKNKCVVEKTDWPGAVGETYKTDTEEFSEYFVLQQEGENLFCIYGQKSGKNCIKEDEKNENRFIPVDETKKDGGSGTL